MALPPSPPANVIKAPATVQHAGPLDLSYRTAPLGPPRARPQGSMIAIQRPTWVGFVHLARQLASQNLMLFPPGSLTEVPSWGAQAQRKSNVPSRSTHKRYGTTPPSPLWPRSALAVSAWRVGATPGTPDQNGVDSDSRPFHNFALHPDHPFRQDQALSGDKRGMLGLKIARILYSEGSRAAYQQGE